ncbi:hypothetical protein IF1G_04939 [Cordyceps javanica]|uniref:Uncharacterized protein n=1 Tax=Cordyceps javanica TaxID=43265 RepID=A0A545V3S3_9HYPO|nr:hypothetical protein IF1G_04939 [Cordyceps javanica]
MISNRVINYFKLLCVIAVMLLWGVSLANGTVKALLLAVWHGELSHGIPLRRSYLGLSLLDLPISLLVAFFFYGTNSHDEGYQLFLVDAYSTLQSAFLWLYVEAARPGDKPVAFGLLWQCLGAAISLPLYYMMHLQWARSGDISRVRSSAEASAIPWSYCLGALMPAAIAMGTTWLGSQSRDSDTHQLLLGLFQLDPVWVSVLQAGVPMLMAVIWPDSDAKFGRKRRKYSGNAYFWVRSSYLLAATASGLGHLYVMIRVITSADKDSVGFVRMYVPFPFRGPAGVGGDVFVYGPWLFLQYDFIVISLSSLSWVYFLLTAPRPSNARGISARILIVCLFLGSIIFGPGATVSVALWYRESILAGGGHA